MAWTTTDNEDAITFVAAPFTVQVFPAGKGYSYEILAANHDGCEVAIIEECPDTFDGIENGQGAALSAFNEMIVRVREKIDAHMEREWIEETGRAHVEGR